jgi:hypothetical protein
MLLSAQEAVMAIRRKTKAKARAKRKKVPITKAARKSRKTIKKRAKKPSPRPAPPKKARPTAKTASKPKSVSKRAPEAVRPSPGRPTLSASFEQRIGVVTHYYGHLSVVAMRLEPGATLHVDDVIHILGHTTDFTQKVESLELNHAPVTEVGPNDDFGLKVAEHAREHDVVFKVQS